jgi:diadenylate cyclase
MQAGNKNPRRGDAEPSASLGFTRTPSEGDPRADVRLLEALSRIAPGSELRAAIDDIILSHEGALIVIGDPTALSFLYSGGIRLDQPFTPQLLYELAKMDGAIIVNQALTKLAYANVQLMPDPTIASNETGTRHRTAERVAKQTGALVISISQQRETVTVFLGQLRYQLDPIASVLAKSNQALATLETYRSRLEQVLTRLTALEFQNAVVLDDVLVVLQRAEMTTRMAEEIERDCVELGSEGRLIRLQLEELFGDVPRDKATVVRDYHVVADRGDAEGALVALRDLSYQDLLGFEELADLLGYPRSVNPLDHSVSPRGYRVLSHIPRLAESVIGRVVAGFDALDAIVRASHRELEAIEGVGPSRAREIREGLRRLQEHNLVDRYLQL